MSKTVCAEQHHDWNVKQSMDAEQNHEPNVKQSIHAEKHHTNVKQSIIIKDDQNYSEHMETGDYETSTILEKNRCQMDKRRMTHACLAQLRNTWISIFNIDNIY